MAKTKKKEKWKTSDSFKANNTDNRVYRNFTFSSELLDSSVPTHHLTVEYATANGRFELFINFWSEITDVLVSAVRFSKIIAIPEQVILKKKVSI